MSRVKRSVMCCLFPIISQCTKILDYLHTLTRKPFQITLSARLALLKLVDDSFVFNVLVSDESRAPVLASDFLHDDSVGMTNGKAFIEQA